MNQNFYHNLIAVLVSTLLIACTACGAPQEGIAGPPSIDASSDSTGTQSGASADDAPSADSEAPPADAEGEAEDDATQAADTSESSTLPSDSLRFWMADVHQGLGLFFISPEGRVVVIDAGTRGNSAGMIQLMKDEGIETVDLAIITHAHNDHIGGFQDVIRDFNVRAFLDPGFEHTSNVYLNLLTQIEQAGIDLYIAEAGATIAVDEHTSIHLVAPSGEFFSNTRSDVNANGIVLVVTFGAHKFLVMGDAEEVTERRLVEEGRLSEEAGLLPIDVISVSHHGSRHSSSAALLDLVTPQIALISCGEGNSYGHPAQETLDRLSEAGAAEIYRTDHHGHVLIESNGEVLSVTPQRVR